MCKTLKVSIFLLFLFSTGYASSTHKHLERTKKQFAAAWSQSPTIDLSSRVDTHKAMIATYFVKPGDTVIDVGAYIGDYTLFYRQLVGEKGKVIAYEANPYVFAYLNHRIAQASFSNIFLREKAVSNTTGEKLLMKVYPGDVGSQSSTVEPALQNEERMPGATEIVEVETEMLDELLNAKETFDIRLIKIDVEGHEHAVFEGAKKLLMTQRPLVIFEYGFLTGKFEPDTIRQMEDLGYICYDLHCDKRVHPRFEVTVTDLLAIPIEREDEVLRVLPYLYY